MIVMWNVSAEYSEACLQKNCIAGRYLKFGPSGLYTFSAKAFHRGVPRAGWVVGLTWAAQFKQQKINILNEKHLNIYMQQILNSWDK